jgi:putative transposase
VGLLQGVALQFSEPGKPTCNAFHESFNGRCRGECLKQHWFFCLEHARAKIEPWRWDYDEDRPLSAPGNLAPGEFARIKAGASGLNR